ncbi:MAG: LytTR family DNA-binding domain-containing protein [Bacteroidota bacterium]
MKTLIIEDEYPAIERLKKLIQEVEPKIEILDTIDSVQAACAWFARHEPPELIFSDIQLSDGLCFEIFEALDIQCPIIFTTAYDEYAVRAFKVKGIDYLLKPIKKGELAAAIQKFYQMKPPLAPVDLQLQMVSLLQALQPQHPSYKSRFLVKGNDKLIPIAASDIAYCYTTQDIVYLVRHNGRKHAIDFKMDQLEELLDPAQFYRVNRQFLCQITAINQVHPYFNGRLKLLLSPAPAEEVIVSRDKAKPLKDWLGA